MNADPLDTFLDAFWDDVEAKTVATEEEYVARFPAAAEGIRASYRNLVTKVDRRVGRFRILEELGHGGQATVYLAHDPKLGRRVALKVLHPGRSVVERQRKRFEREAGTASRLSHRDLCQVFESGEDGDSFWIAMEFIEGASLARLIATARDRRHSQALLPVAKEDESQQDGSSAADGQPEQVRRILKLFERAARALDKAHSQGVIHRDVKPGNIMVRTDGTPVIVDFGLAQDSESEAPSTTETGEPKGTPQYMSVEQFAAKRVPLDPRTDVYSLGVALYESLTLASPFAAPTRAGIYQLLLTRTPPNVRKLNPALSRDVGVIVETAIDRDRARRYETAAALAEDLRRARALEPILARPIDSVTRFTRWVRRNPAVAWSLITVLVTLTIGVILTAMAWRAKTVALDREQALRLLSASTTSLPRDSALGLLLALEGARGFAEDPVRVNGAILDALADLREVRTVRHPAIVRSAEFSPDASRIVTTSNGVVSICDVTTGSCRHRNVPGVFEAAFTPSGRSVVTRAEVLDPNSGRPSSGDPVFEIWDAASWTRLARLDRVGNRTSTDAGAVSRSAFGRPKTPEALRGDLAGHQLIGSTRDYALTATLSGGTITVWDTDDGKPLAVLEGVPGEFERRRHHAGFTLDGKRVVVIVPGVATRIWDISTGSARTDVPVLPADVYVRAIRVSSDGNRIAFFNPEGNWLCCVESALTIRLKGRAVEENALIDFSPEGTRLLAVAEESLRVWNCETGSELQLCGSDTGAPVPATEAALPAAAFIGEALVVTAKCDGNAQVWSTTPSGQKNTDGSPTVDPALGTLSGHESGVTLVGVSPDRGLILTASANGSASLWDAVRRDRKGTLRGHSSTIKRFSFSQDGSMLLTVAGDRTARVWNVQASPGAPALATHEGKISDVAWSPDGGFILTSSNSNEIRLFDAVTTAMKHKLSTDLDSIYSGIVFSPDGRRVLSTSQTGREVGKLTVWHLRDGNAFTFPGGSRFSEPRFGRDGDTLIALSDDGSIRVWDLPAAPDQPGRSFPAVPVAEDGHAEARTRLELAAEGRRILTHSGDAIHLWDAAGNSVRGISRVRGFTANRGGTRLALTSLDGVVTICEGLTGMQLSALPQRSAEVALLSPAGNRVLGKGPTGRLELWDAETVSLLRALPRDEADRVLGISPDGSRLLTTKRFDRIRLWDLDGRPVGELRGEITDPIRLAFSPCSRWIALGSPRDVSLYDARTGEARWTVPTRYGDVQAICFSPDGSWGVTGHASGAVRVWPSDPLGLAPGLLPREFTLDERKTYELGDASERALVSAIFKRELVEADVIRALEDARLDEQLRRAAIDEARAQDTGTVTENLRQRIWSVTSRKDASQSEVDAALGWAAEARRLSGPQTDRADVFTAIGAAQYRAGSFQDALRSFEQSARIYRGPGKDPLNSLFAAMAHHRLGEHDLASRALAEVRTTLDGAGLSPDDDASRLLREAAALIDPGRPPPR